MDKKAADYYIDRKNREEENKKEQDQQEKAKGAGTTAADLRRAVEKL